MLKKIVLSVLFVGLIGVLVAGAVIRTVDRTDRVAEASNEEHGRNVVESDDPTADDGNGNGYRGGASDGSGIPSGGAGQAMVGDWVTVAGTVTAVELDALTIETAEGETMLAQLGPEHFWAEQGIVIKAGDQVEITGFYEDDGAFAAGQVTLLATGETLVLREADGRPLWAGGPGSAGRGGNASDHGNHGDTAPSTPAELVAPGDLDDTEAEGLLFMREEEKLARDVYITLYDLWGTAVFDNIASSEQTHMDAIKTLLDRYSLEDPAAGQGVGEFTNPDLQALYDQLVAQGSQSLVEALRVGAAIEEIDILDLQEYIAQTDNADLQQVYQSLLQGSENHLRAFVSVLERQGESYQPQYFSQEAYDAIISADSGRGGGNGQGGRGQGNH